MGSRSAWALLSVSVSLGFIVSCATQASDAPVGSSSGGTSSGGAGGSLGGGGSAGGSAAAGAGAGAGQSASGGSAGTGGVVNTAGTAGGINGGAGGAGGTVGASGTGGTTSIGGSGVGGSGAAGHAGAGGAGGTSAAGSGGTGGSIGAGGGGASSTGGTGGTAGAGGNGGVVGKTYTLSNFVIGSSAASATVHVTWNATKIEFVFDVQDATPFDDSAINWEDDAGEIYLDLNDSKGGGFDGDDCEIVIPRATGTIDGTGLSTGQYAGITVQRTSVGATGYTLDVSVPWTSVNVTTPPLGKTIGLNLAVDDDTNGGDRDAQLLLSGDQFAYNKPSAWASLPLN